MFSYDKATGIVRWRISPGGGVLAGARAGTVAQHTPNYRCRQIMFERKLYKEHQLIWLIVKGKWCRPEVDHRDNDATNNRWRNLRRATSGQNKLNGSLTGRNRSGLKWVRTIIRADLKRPRYQAACMGEYLGTYDTPEQAHRVAVLYAKKRCGAFFNSGASRAASQGVRM